MLTVNADSQSTDEGHVSIRWAQKGNFRNVMKSIYTYQNRTKTPFLNSEDTSEFEFPIFRLKKSFFSDKKKFQWKKFIFWSKFIEFFFHKISSKKWVFTKIKIFMKCFDEKTHWKHLKMMNFTLKPLILINFVKKNRLVASLGKYVSGGPLRGG